MRVRDAGNDDERAPSAPTPSAPAGRAREPAGPTATSASDRSPSIPQPVTSTDRMAMRRALAEAALAARHGDVPVGAVALVEGEIVASHHNERELRGDPTAHAELLALRTAAEVTGRWRLEDVTLVVTLEPCAMCAGALVAGRVGRLVYGAADPKAGACGSLYNLCADPRLNHEVAVTPGVLATESATLLTTFFASRRG